MLRNRVAYLQKENELPHDESLLIELLELEELAHQSRNLYAEHVVKGIPGVHERIKHNLERMRDMELELIPRLMEQLKRHHTESLQLA